jgi:hypothetical protein
MASDEGAESRTNGADERDTSQGLRSAGRAETIENARRDTSSSNAAA